MSDGASARRPGAAPPRAPRAEKRAQQRQRILDSARAVFFRDGFMAANLDEVAERAGVAKGTLYRYFENKAELYVAVLTGNGDEGMDSAWSSWKRRTCAGSHYHADIDRQRGRHNF